MRPRDEGDAACLLDIRQACAHIVASTRGKKLPDFVDDSVLQGDIAFRLITIGEASKSLTDKTRRSMPTVKWKDMARMRDLFVHRYWNIDAVQVWEIVQNDIPELLALLERQASRK